MRREITFTARNHSLGLIGDRAVSVFAAVVDSGWWSRGYFDVHWIAVDADACRSEHGRLRWLSKRPRGVASLRAESGGGRLTDTAPGKRLIKRIEADI